MRDQLRSKALVERNRRGLACGVVDHAGRRDVAGERGDGDDHAVVGGDHGGQELLREVVVAEGVYFEGEVDVLFGGFEDGFAARDARVVDEDGGVAERGADLRGCAGDGGGG